MEKEKVNKTRVNDDLTAYYKKLNLALFNLSNEEFYKYFENAFLNGDRKFYQKNISETKTFDDTWIKTLESYFPSLDKITREPRSSLRYDEDIVAIERAKKTSSKSVRHLASHTEYIREVDENNYVTPKRVLVENAEQDFATYENRFIMTLIDRLFLFVRNRYEIIKGNVESSQRDHLDGNVSFNFNNTKVDMNIDLVITKDLDDKSINEHNHDLLKRTENLNYLVSALKGSKFMQLLKGANPVHPPIMKTNVITKNPEFRNAYNLWIFLDKYSILGYDVTIKEKDLDFDDEFINDINRIFAAAYVSTVGNHLSRKEIYDKPDGYTELIKKKTKIVSQDPKDFVADPDLIQMEDVHLNEYFLKQYRTFFDKTIEESMEEAEREEENDTDIKRAIRQATDIVNSIYEDKFEISEENDILRRLEEVDIQKEYDDSLKQLRYAKLIREVKEVDYNNFFRTERRLLRALSQTNTKMIKKLIEERKYEEKERKIKEIENRIEELKKENENRAKEIEALARHQELMKEEKEKILEERNKVINRVNEAIKEFDSQMSKRYEEERQKVLKLLEEEKARSKKLKEKYEEAKKTRQKALLGLISKERAKAREEMNEVFNTHKEKLEKAKEEIRNVAVRYKERLDREAEYRALLDRQREKEEIAILKVKKYEELKVIEDEMEDELSEYAFLKEKEESKYNAMFDGDIEKLASENKEKILEETKEKLKEVEADFEKRKADLRKLQKEREALAKAKVKKYEEKNKGAKSK